MISCSMTGSSCSAYARAGTVIYRFINISLSLISLPPLSRSYSLGRAVKPFHFLKGVKDFHFGEICSNTIPAATVKWAWLGWGL